MTEGSGSPLVSIVVPLHDGGRFVGETLRSVLAQTMRRFEVIVVDDGSTDDGPDIVRAIADPRLRLERIGHRGVAAARNTGAALASEQAEYLIFLDADDVWRPETLEVLVDALAGRPDAAGAFVLADYVDLVGDVLHEGDFPRHMRGREDLEDGRLVPRDVAADVHFEHLFLSNLVYPPSCLLLRRSAFELAGGFDGRFLAEDWEFVVRLARHGSLVPVDRVMVGYRRHSVNASGDRSRNVRGARQVWAAVFHARYDSAETSARLRAIWRAHQARTAARKLAEGRALIVRGRLLRGSLKAADGMAHVLLRRPPRVWMRLGSRTRNPESRASASPRP